MLRLTDLEIEDVIFCIRRSAEDRNIVYNKMWEERRAKLLNKFVDESYKRNFKWWQRKRWF